MARPTKSHVLFQQMVGRGVRLYKYKKNCLVIDFVDNFSKSSKLVGFPTLLGLDPDSIEEKILYKKQNLQSILESARKESDYHSGNLETLTRKLRDPYAIFKLSQDDVEKYKWPGLNSNESFSDAITSGDIRLINLSQLTWVSTSKDKFVLSSPKFIFFLELKCQEPSEFYHLESDIHITENNRNLSTPKSHMDNEQPTYIGYYKRRIYSLVKNGQSGYISKKIEIPLSSNILEQAFKGMDKFINSKLNYTEYRLLFRNQNWRHSAPSEKQVKYLEKLGIPSPLINLHLNPTIDNEFSLNSNSPLEKMTPYNNKKLIGYMEDDLSTLDFSPKHSRYVFSQKNQGKLLPEPNYDSETIDRILKAEESAKMMKKAQKFYKKEGIPYQIKDEKIQIGKKSDRIVMTKGSVANLITRLLYKEKTEKVIHPKKSRRLIL
ncbi:putative mitochondrial ATP-dependent helicase irc3 [Smittium mucronatum]|uniref:Putative mitochondrial ATP-dependent helicase irc3 n=1 Tax=Smittium mucronatum TaxID=133383 RepID=A0A1R0H612_9FUNG|nr:putative mitochondrial ATP-dependent helicase irc3 [Smittium mucronatum]